MGYADFCIRLHNNEQEKGGKLHHHFHIIVIQELLSFRFSIRSNDSLLFCAPAACEWTKNRFLHRIEKCHSNEMENWKFRILPKS